MPTSQDEALLEVIYPMLDELSDQEKISVRSMLEGVIERVEKGSKKYYFASVLLVNFPPTFEESERMKMILTTVFKIDVDAISSEVVVQ